MTTWTRHCRGCGKVFEASTPNQQRCTNGCGFYSATQAYKRARRYASGHTFIGVDGEGVTSLDGTHNYVLLSVGNESLTVDKGSRLSFYDIMPFLWEQYLKNPTAVFCGFYLSYDFAQWFRALPEERGRMLFTDYGRMARTPKSKLRIMPFPVRHAGWEFDMLGLRRFKLRPEQSADPRWLYVCDVGGFWQTSFLNAIDPRNWADQPIVTDHEYEVIAAGKRNRSKATLAQIAKTTKYNTLENDVLARAMQRIETGFEAQGWKLKRSHYFGPGQAAQAWLNNIHAPRSTAIHEHTPKDVMLAARFTYYGGWFEIPRHGHIPGTSYEYDINSAYPHAIATLPCLLHGSWKRNALEGPYQLVYVKTSGIDKYLGGLPHRDPKGIICRPHHTEGWYWRSELDAAHAAGLVDDYSITDSWSYLPCKCLPPFRLIKDLYNLRLEVGKNTAHGKALKLVYNSCYGKFAQSIGEPKYANALYASLITSTCRTRILDSIATHPLRSKGVLMVATDGVYFRTPHPSLTVSPNTLGEWDSGEKTNLTLYMPGVYWDDKARATLATDEAPKLKSRGINAKELASKIREIDDKFASWDGEDWPQIEIPIRFSVISPVLALARNNWGLCGTIQTYDLHGTTKVLSSDPTNKRVTVPYMEDGLWTTYPYSDQGVTYGYKKLLGMSLEQMLDNDILITDDGTVNRELYEVLSGEASPL